MIKTGMMDHMDGKRRGSGEVDGEVQTRKRGSMDPYLWEHERNGRRG